MFGILFTAAERRWSGSWLLALCSPLQHFSFISNNVNSISGNCEQKLFKGGEGEICHLREATTGRLLQGGGTDTRIKRGLWKWAGNRWAVRFCSLISCEWGKKKIEDEVENAAELSKVPSLSTWAGVCLPLVVSHGYSRRQSLFCVFSLHSLLVCVSWGVDRWVQTLCFTGTLW